MKKTKIKIESINFGDLIEYNGDLFLILSFNGTDHYYTHMVFDFNSISVKKKSFVVFCHKLFRLTDDE